MGDGVAMVARPWNVCDFCGSLVEKPVGAEATFFDGDYLTCQACGVEHAVIIPAHGAQPLMGQCGVLHHYAAQTEEGERLEEILTTIELRYFLFGFAVEVEESQAPRFGFRFYVRVRDVDTGEPRTFVQAAGFFVREGTPEAEIRDIIYRGLLIRLEHELNHAWHEDGERTREATVSGHTLTSMYRRLNEVERRLAVYERDQALCVCGHTDEMHDGGIGGQWCDGQGTWTYTNPQPRAERCQCQMFQPASRRRDARA